MATQVASLFGVLRMDDSDFQKSISSAKDSSEDLGQRLQKLGGGISGLGTSLTVLGAPITAFFGLSVKGAADMESAMAQTDAVIKSTGGAAGQTTDQIVKMASAMQMTTGIQKDTIESGENLLLTFTNIGGDTFPRATQAMLDMSVAMKQDLKSSAIQLGKALNDPVDGMTALTRVGVTFTDQQQEAVKSMVAMGDTAGAQALILKELEREFGGSAEAAGKTFAGQLAIAQRGVEDIQDVIGAALIPSLSDLLTQVKPVLTSIMDWVKANPDLIKGIALIAGGLTIIGPILIGAGAAISAIGGVIGVVLGPIGLIVAAVAGLALAWKTNFLGIRNTLQPIIDNIVNGFKTLFGVLGNLGNIINTQGIGSAIDYIINAFAQMFGLVGSDDFFEPIRGIGDKIMTVFLTVGQFLTGTVLPAIGEFLRGAADFAINVALPALLQLGDWFLNTALPAIVGFVTGTVIPAIQTFFTWLGNAWAAVGPGLLQLADWFLNTALPAVVGFITGTVIPAIGTFINFLSNAWAAVGPGLLQLADWFINTALPAIVNFITTEVIPRVGDFINLLLGIWDTVSPFLEKLFNWFITDGLPAIRDFIVNEVIPRVQDFVDLLVGIWDSVSPFLQKLYDWFITDGLPAIRDFIRDEVMPRVQGFIDILVGIWTVVQPGLDDLKNGISNIFNWIKDNIIQPVIDRITEFINTISGIGNTVSGVTGGIGDFINSITGPGTLLGGVGTTLDQLAQIGAAVQGQGVVALPPPTNGAFTPTSGDYEGVHPAGAYVVGTGAQPQLFMPKEDMYGVPNIDEKMGGGGDTIMVTINAGPGADGYKLANDFETRLRELRRQRG